MGEACSRSEALPDVRCVGTQRKAHIGLKPERTLTGGLERKTDQSTPPRDQSVFDETAK